MIAHAGGRACVASIIHQWFPCIYQTIAAKDTVHWLAAPLLMGTNRSDGRPADSVQYSASVLLFAVRE